MGTHSSVASLELLNDALVVLAQLALGRFCPRSWLVSFGVLARLTRALLTKSAGLLLRLFAACVLPLTQGLPLRFRPSGLSLLGIKGLLGRDLRSLSFAHPLRLPSRRRLAHPSATLRAEERGPGNRRSA